MTRLCAECRSDLQGRTSTRYCSNACRQRAYRRRRKTDVGGIAGQIEILNLLQEILRPGRVDNYAPEIKLHFMGLLREALRDLEDAVVRDNAADPVPPSVARRIARRYRA